MSNINEDLNYLFGQFKGGILFGAGVTFLGSGILIGFKTASFIIGIANNVGSDGLVILKRELLKVLSDEEDTKIT